MNGGSPYRGLAAFDDSDVDALYFFGRERDAEIVVANLIASRLTVLYGPSGVGKSSLLLASVARTLRRLPEEPLVIVFSTWSDHPEPVLARAIADAAGIPPGPLVEVVTAVQGDRDLYVILDQAEEYFTDHGGDDGFDEALAELVDGRLRVNVLLSLREDALAALDRLKGSIPGLFGNVLRLDRLDRGSGRAAIVKPLERWSDFEGDPVTIEDELVAAVLDGVGEGRIELGPGGQGTSAGNGRVRGVEAPYLQLVMQRLWDVGRATGATTLRAATLDELGGARQVVADHLETAIAALTPAQRDIGARLFAHLVTPSGSKIAHETGDLAEFAGSPQPAVSDVLDVLAAHRILRADEVGRWEIFHDVLAAAVLGWRTRYEAERAVARASDEARRRNRRLAFIAGSSLAGLALAVGLAVWALTERQNAREQTTAARAAEERASTQASLALRAEQDAERQAAAATRARQSALVQAAAAKRAERAAVLARREAEGSARDARQAEQKAVEQAAVAQHERDRADAEAVAARTARSKADTSAVAATRARTKAERAAVAARRARVNAERAALVARAREKLARAQALLASDPERGLQAALESLTLDPTSPAEGVLREGLLRSRVVDILPGGGGELIAVFPDASGGGQAASTESGGAVVTVSRRGVVRVFDSRLGTLIREIDTRATLSSAALARDRRTIAVGGGDGIVRLYDIATGRAARTLNHVGPVSSVAFSPDGRLLASSGTNETAKIWDLNSGAMVRRLEHPRAVRSASFSPDSARLVTLSSDRFVRIFDVPTGKQTARLDQTETPTSAAFSPDGRRLVTTGQDEVPHLWDADTGALLTSLEGHSGNVLASAYSPAGDKIATASTDGTARVWNPETGQLLLQLVGHTSFVDTVAFSPDGTRILTASRDATARTWNAVTGALQTSFLGHRGRVTAAAFGGEGRWAVTAGEDGTARTWSLAFEPELTQIAADASSIVDVAVSRAGELVAAARADGTITVHTSQGRLVVSVDLGGPAATVALSDDGKRVLATGADGAVEVWALPGGGAVARFDHGAPAAVGAFLPNGRDVVTGGRDGVVRLWDLASRRARAVAREALPVADVAVSPDGELVAVATGDDAWVHGLSARRGVKFTGHRDAVTSVAFSPDGNRLVTASFDHDVLLWDVRTGRRTKSLIGHVAVVRGASFSADGRWVATAGPARVGLWEVGASGLVDSRLTYLAGHRGGVRAVAFSPTGWRAYSGGADGTLRRYACVLCAGTDQLRRIAAAKLERLAVDLKR